MALLTDGRMSGASGKILAAIHVSPEAFRSGAIAQIRDGDVITIDSERGILNVEAELDDRQAADLSPLNSVQGMGRELSARTRRF